MRRRPCEASLEVTETSPLSTPGTGASDEARVTASACGASARRTSIPRAGDRDAIHPALREREGSGFETRSD